MAEVIRRTFMSGTKMVVDDQSVLLTFTDGFAFRIATNGWITTDESRFHSHSHVTPIDYTLRDYSSVIPREAILPAYIDPAISPWTPNTRTEIPARNIEWARRNVTFDHVWSALTEEPAPDLVDDFGSPKQTGDNSSVMLLNPTAHLIDDTNFFVLNTTLPSHQFQDGFLNELDGTDLEQLIQANQGQGGFVLRRQTVDDNGVISIENIGIGSGDLRDFNQIVGPATWELNKYALKNNAIRHAIKEEEERRASEQCFAAGTMIRMANGTERPIEQICIGDQVMSFNGPNGALVASTVTQTFETADQLVIEFHGTNVTPGHVCACADGEYRMLIDILEQDGAIVIADGTHIRARTGYEVGTDEDAIVMVGLEQIDGDTKFVPMRAGTMIGFQDGRAITMLEYMDSIGWRLEKEGKGFKVRDYITRDTMGFAWYLSTVPFDPRLVAGEYSEYRQGRIRVAKGRPVFPEDREYNGVIPAQFVTAH